MPVIDVAKIRVEADKVNQTMGRFFASSLDPLLKELGSQPSLMADPAKITKLQELVFHIPHDKQLKYKSVLDLLETAGIYSCGRPCDPSMHFVRFDQGAYSYVGLSSLGQDKMVTLDPGSLHHVFDFKWKSTTGSMQSLAKVHTREWVKFRTPQRAAPFNDVMPPDMEFYWGQSFGASSGSGRDDHSIKPPKLVCRFPWVAGENVAEQWYQYSLDGQQWHNIPGAAYLLTKGVRGLGTSAVFYFRKSNWAPHNTKPYKFEAEYPLGPPLVYRPKTGQAWMRTNGSQSEISRYGRLISAG